jgi:O-antigen/teichoic acid export membrane protein
MMTYSGNNLAQTIVKNASANLVRLAGTGIIALLLPPFLVRELSKDTYAAWAILLQLTLYVTYLDFGIQTAVSRFVAHEEELHNTRERDSIVSTAFALLTLAACLGCIVIAVLAWQLPAIFKQMPAALYLPARIGLLLMGTTLAIGLPVNVIQALFIGKQRNEIPAVIGVANKVAMAIFVVAVVLKRWDLAAMGAAVALANVLSYAASYFAWRRWAAQVRIRVALVSKQYARIVTTYSGAVMVSSIAMLMISGLDLTVVGIFDYKSTAYYAIAATLSTFVAQAHGAVFSALLPASAVLTARQDSHQLGALLLTSTRYGVLLLLAISVPLLVGGHFIIMHWAGADYAEHSTVILMVLLTANIIRLTCLPYATLLLGTGQQGKAMVSPIAEGVTNLVASIIGAVTLGALGVAVGTLIGSVVGVAFHLFYNVPRTSLISINRRQLIKQGLLRPLSCVLPFLFILPFLSTRSIISGDSHQLLLVVATAGAVLLFWNCGLLSSDRQRLTQVFHLSGE